MRVGEGITSWSNMGRKKLVIQTEVPMVAKSWHSNFRTLIQPAFLFS